LNIQQTALRQTGLVSQIRNNLYPKEYSVLGEPKVSDALRMLLKNPDDKHFAEFKQYNQLAVLSVNHINERIYQIFV